MFCTNCGAQTVEGAAFCTHCGVTLTRTLEPGPQSLAVGLKVGSEPQSLNPGVDTLSADQSGRPELELIYAGFWQRTAAILIDVSISLAIIGLITKLYGPDDAARVFAFVFGWLYFAVMESSVRQATLGKLALRIKVTDVNGERISFQRATGRYFARIVSALPLGAGYIAAAFTKRRQGFHDMLASTLVLRKEATQSMFVGANTGQGRRRE